MANDYLLMLVGKYFATVKKYYLNKTEKFSLSSKGKKIKAESAEFHIEKQNLFSSIQANSAYVIKKNYNRF